MIQNSLLSLILLHQLKQHLQIWKILLPQTIHLLLLSSLPINYGLEGLIHAIRTINSTPDQSTPSLFSLGSDLSTWDWIINSSDPLYPKFTSPWIDLRGSVDSLLPSCYFVPQSLTGLLGKIASLNDETLFYLFYGMPRDKGQVQAAIELFQRGWRYHRGLKLWFSQASTDSRSAFFSPQSSDSTSTTASTAKSLPSDYSEKGTFVFSIFLPGNGLPKSLWYRQI